MPIERVQFVEQFAKQALDNRISLFLGAGGSCDVGYPNWADLFAPLARDLQISINESTDYYQLAQYYVNNFGSALLRQKINEQINRNSYHSELLSELLNIGFNNIWTTNFDNALELNYQNKGILTNKVFKDPDFSNVDLYKRINIFKMNGDVSSLDSIVATQSDFEAYTDNHRVMLMFFKRELISNTFLFIGYSFTDHLVLDCLSEIARYLGESSNYHYTIMKNDRDNPYFKYFVEDLEKRYHIKVLLVDNYEEIPDVLADLNNRIRCKRVFFSGAFSICDQTIEEYSHRFSRNVASSILAADYRIVNGIGRRFGTHLIGYATEYLVKEGIKDIERHLIIRPFVAYDGDADKKKRLEREKIISQCGATIFIFGEQDNNGENHISGVMEEFNIARKLHKTIIPIAYPNMVSSTIWNIVKKNITEYPYLEGKIDFLNSNYPPDKLAKIIVQILDAVSFSK